MNGFTGLALLKMVVFNSPKINNMNTLQTDFRSDQQWIKQLFKELFQIQIELENSKVEYPSFNYEVNELILTIDELLTILIDLYQSIEH